MGPANRQGGVLQRILYPGLPAGLLFLAVSVFLFWPLPSCRGLWGTLLPANSFLAAMGCFVLSRRWLDSFWASAIAGAAYGFGPFVLSFKLYHPLAGFSIALLPWLFCPGAFWNRLAKPSLSVALRRLPLLVLPFAFLFLFYWLASLPRLGPYSLMPSTQQIGKEDILSILEFPTPPANKIIIGFYANAFILAVMGLFVYSYLLRALVLLPPLLGFVLAFSQPLLNVPPVVWVAVPMLFLSVLAGLGAQAMVVAGPADRKWILACLLLAAFLAVFCFFFAFSRPDRHGYWTPAVMYGLSFLSIAAVYGLCTQQIRLHFLRWLLLTAALGADLFYTSRMLIASL